LTRLFRFIGGTERYPSYTFSYKQPVPVARVCIHLTGGAGTFVIRGDVEGKENFTELIAKVEGVKGVKDWVIIDTGDKPLYSLRIEGIEGSLRGYRSSFTFIDEVKIFAGKEKVSPLLSDLQKKAVFKGPGYPRAGIPYVALERVDFKLPPAERKKDFGKMLTTDLWMFGINLKKDTSVIDYSKSESFRKVVQACRLVGFNSVMIFLEESWKNLVPWPSKVANGTDENILKALCDALHKEGLKVYVMPSSALSPPFAGGSLFIYPKEESSRYPQMKQFPGIVHGKHYRDNWLALLDEAMASGADGVSLCPDENYYKGHFMETLPRDDEGRKLYQQRFGYPLPFHEEDSLKFRQWILMRHQGICGLYQYWAEKLKGKYPGVHLTSRFMVPVSGYSNITETGIPLDILGETGALNELSSDYLGPYGIQMMAAANGWRKGGMCFDACMWGPLQGADRKTDMEIMGEVMWSVMYGLGAIDVYRENYLWEQGTLPGFIRAFGVLSDLERLGVKDARPPAKIALLSSRTSIDWWQIKAWWGEHQDLHWDRGVEGTRGWFADSTVYNILQQNGIPFDWFFLDNDQHLDKLDNYKLLIIPFAHSISKEAIEKIKEAADKGTRIILFDGKAGSADRWGEPYAEPALKELLDSEKAVLFEEDILADGATDIFAGKVAKTIQDILGENIPLKLETYGRWIDATLLEKNPEEYFLFLLNWEKAGLTRVDVGLSLPEGNYEVMARDADFWYKASINGKTTLSRQDMNNFRVWMVPETVYVFYIRGKQ
jgi:hypothetical protein